MIITVSSTVSAGVTTTRVDIQRGYDEPNTEFFPVYSQRDRSMNISNASSLWISILTAVSFDRNGSTRSKVICC